jgi:hypothetical protein
MQMVQNDTVQKWVKGKWGHLQPYETLRCLQGLLQLQIAWNGVLDHQLVWMRLVVCPLPRVLAHWNWEWLEMLGCLFLQFFKHSLCIFIVLHSKCSLRRCMSKIEKFWKKICKMQCGVSDTCNAMWVTLNWTLKIQVQQSCTILTQSGWTPRNEIAVKIVQCSYLTWGGDLWQPWLGRHLFLETHLQVQESHHCLFSYMKLLLIMSFTSLLR